MEYGVRSKLAAPARAAPFPYSIAIFPATANGQVAAGHSVDLQRRTTDDQ